jgi:hypothetical protein
VNTTVVFPFFKDTVAVRSICACDLKTVTFSIFDVTVSVSDAEFWKGIKEMKKSRREIIIPN